MKLLRAPGSAAGLALGAALAALAPLAPAQRGAKKKPVLVPFVGTLEEAKRSALERNVPLLLHVILEGEPQNDEYRDQILPHAPLLELCERAVVVVANNGEHARRKLREEVEGVPVEREVCAVYPMFERCEQHRAGWDPIYFEFHDPDGEMRCPQTILLDPAGAIAWRFNVANPPPPAEVVDALKAAQRKAGRGLDLVELAAVREALGAARRAVEETAFARAWLAWNALSQLVSAGPFAAEARTGLESALEKLRAELGSLQAALVPGKAGPAWRALRAFVQELTGTPLEKEARAALARAEKDAQLKPEIDAEKLELEADELWAQAQALLEQGDARKAERNVRRLLRGKLAATRAGQLARERHPDWAAEEDAKGKGGSAEDARSPSCARAREREHGERDGVPRTRDGRPCPPCEEDP